MRVVLGHERWYANAMHACSHEKSTERGGGRWWIGHGELQRDVLGEEEKEEWGICVNKLVKL